MRDFAMNDKLRSVNTKFWDDSFVQEITPSERLLFLYLLTNPLTNLLGVYEITEKRISFDTGLNYETIRNGFERFGKAKKAFFLQNFVILPNWLKNQRLNSNMKIAVAREFNQLPKELKSNILGNHSEGFINGSEGFEMINECLGKYEIEIESEIEDENKDEKDKNIPTFEDFKNYTLENEPNIDLKALELKYKSWIENKWKDGNNKPIKNWKSKILNTIPHLPLSKIKEQKGTINLSEILK